MRVKSPGAFWKLYFAETMIDAVAIAKTVNQMISSNVKFEIPPLTTMKISRNVSYDAMVIMTYRLNILLSLIIYNL